MTSDLLAHARHVGRIEGVVITACSAVLGGCIAHFLIYVVGVLR